MGARGDSEGDLQKLLSPHNFCLGVAVAEESNTERS